MKRSRTTRSGALATALVGGLLLLTACSGAAGPGSTPPSAPSSTPAPVASLTSAVDCLAPNVLDGFLLPRAPESGTPKPDTTEPGTAEPGGSEEPTAVHTTAPEPGRVPEGFVPTAAYLCTVEFSFDTDSSDGSAEGAATVIVEKRTGDFGPLLAALAEPDQQPKPDQVCTADFEIVPELWLEEASGQAMRAAWPRDACGKTQPATQAALDELTVASRTVLPVP